MNTECVNHLRFGCKCSNCWWSEPGKVILTAKEQERRNRDALQQFLDREGQELAKRESEQFAKLQDLMQRESVFDPPRLARTFVLRFTVGDRNGDWGSFPSREKAAELAEGLVNHKLVDTVSIYEHVGHYSVFTEEPK